MKRYKENPFVFSPKYRLLRHVTFWLIHILIFSFIFWLPDVSYWRMHLLSAIWVPTFILYSYTIMYWFIPQFLLKDKYLVFIFALTCWAILGYFLNYFTRVYIFFPFTDYLQIPNISRNPWAAGSYLTMNVMAGFGSMIVLFKSWFQKQEEFLSAEKEKINAELQLLKAQVHPHFLINTLNNIYSFSLQNSDKTPYMVLALTSLLSYILYDCRASQVLLEKELNIMQNYIDLEKERYGNKLEISVNIEGDITHKFISPLLILPFLENAFKHGTSEVLEAPWLSMDIAVKNNILICKIVNSKNETIFKNRQGIGISNVQKRLQYLYPGKHDLKLADEGDFFAVALSIDLSTDIPESNQTHSDHQLQTLPI